MLSRKFSSFLVAAIVAGISSASYADFAFTSTRTTLGSNDVIVVAIQNTGTNGTGTGLQGFDITLTTNTGSFVVDQSVDVDGDGVNDSNIIGTTDSGFDDPYGDSNGTWVRMKFGGITTGKSSNASSTITAGDLIIGTNSASTPGYLSDPTGTGSQTFFQQLSNYTNQNSLTFVAATTVTGGFLDTSPNNFLNIVVPTGATVTLSGSAGGDMGNPATVSATFTSSVPEPASLGVLALGGLALLARRKRA